MMRTWSSNSFGMPAAWGRRSVGGDCRARASTLEAALDLADGGEVLVHLAAIGRAEAALELPGVVGHEIETDCR